MEVFKLKLDRSIWLSLLGQDKLLEAYESFNIYLNNLLKHKRKNGIKEEIDLFSSIVRKQKNLLNLKRNIVFWMKMDEFKYKIYYIRMFEVKYEKILDTRDLNKEAVEKIKREIKDMILKEGKSDRIIKKEEIDYINIVNEYIKNTEYRGYIVV